MHHSFARLIAGSALAVTTLLSGQAPAASAAAVRSFDIVNVSSTTLLSVHVSPSGNLDWGNDKLGNNYLYPGGVLHIAYDPYWSGCFQDIEVTDVNGRVFDFWDQDVCTVSTLYYY
jgi:hypothetical protein